MLFDMWRHITGSSLELGAFFMSYRSVLNNLPNKQIFLWKWGNIQTLKKLEKTWRTIAQESLSLRKKNVKKWVVALQFYTKEM